MAMRWKRNPRQTGLARVASGPQGSTLRIDGVMRVATVAAHYSRGTYAGGWYWVAGWECEKCRITIAAKIIPLPSKRQRLRQWNMFVGILAHNVGNNGAP